MSDCGWLFVLFSAVGAWSVWIVHRDAYKAGKFDGEWEYRQRLNREAADLFGDSFDTTGGQR